MKKEDMKKARKAVGTIVIAGLTGGCAGLTGGCAPLGIDIAASQLRDKADRAQVEKMITANTDLRQVSEGVMPKKGIIGEMRFGDQTSIRSANLPTDKDAMYLISGGQGFRHALIIDRDGDGRLESVTITPNDPSLERITIYNLGINKNDTFMNGWRGYDVPAKKETTVKPFNDALAAYNNIRMKNQLPRSNIDNGR
jgi:hypothetical protein